MRILHMTDVHFFHQPKLGGIFGKRLLGLANLYVGGRMKYFDPQEVVERAVADALQWDVDLFVLTGDVTAMAQDSEFEQAREAFGPLLRSLPSVVIPGNHDTYTTGAIRNSRMERHFASWMCGGTWDEEAGKWDGGPTLGDGEAVPWPVRFRLGGTDIIATNPCRATLRASGRFQDGAIERAEALVRQSRSDGQQVVYLLHYPILSRDGSLYRRDGHSLVDLDDLVASLKRESPDLILHGHKHEAYRVDLPQDSDGSVPILNCGTTSAVSPLMDRAAGYYVIDLSEGAVQSVKRRVLLQGAASFSDHPGLFLTGA